MLVETLKTRPTAAEVYAVRPTQEREVTPLYCAARELVERYSTTHRIADFGCSDLVATRLLIEKGFKVFGLDIDLPSLLKARENGGTDLVQANIRNLPLFDFKQIDTVLLLEVVEHLKLEEASVFLKRLKDLNQNLTLIVSMPNVSPLSFYTWKEGWRVIMNGKRPPTGLFDETHQILTDISGHMRLFASSGWEVVEQSVTCSGEGVTGGSWQTIENLRPISNLGKLHQVVAKGFSEVVYPGNSDKQKNLEMTIRGYQGLYVLK